ncbi:transposase [Methanoregula sp.]|uniref:ISH6 family transposase n=1 Tax=Methanoregula sp. TaxID=2052170 RepID=UPI000CB931D4|nr:transposase [Methanoregula sp.]PKG31637.1 MAG: ISH6 family transposase [Methanoregula sp.]
MQITISMNVNVCLPDNEKVPIEAIEYSLKNQNLDAKVLEQVLTAIDAKLVTIQCGEKYSKDQSNRRYRRAGTSRKTVITSVGPVTIPVNKVRDTERNRVTKPLYDRVQFAGKHRYQTSVSMISVDFAQKMSYRDTVEELSLVIREVPSRMTINNLVKEFGKSIGIGTGGKSTRVLMADGTKAHSQEPGVKQNEINVALGINDDNKILLGVTVNQKWERLAEKLGDEKMLSEEAVIVCDGETELRNAFSSGNIQFQTDLIHGFRILGYKLWEDSALNLNGRKAIINDLKMLLLSLKNVVVYHKYEPDRISDKINQVVDGMESLSARLMDLGCHKAAKFLNEYSNTLVTFARLAIHGIKIPWNSNRIERLMGEISKRVKHKWMRWTTEGLETILKLILVRYTSPERYKNFRDTKLGLISGSMISVQISVNHSVQ